MDLASQTAWTAGDADIASSSMRIGETLNRPGSGCAVIASTGARSRHGQGTGLRDGNGSLKDDLDRHCMQIGALGYHAKNTWTRCIKGALQPDKCRLIVDSVNSRHRTPPMRNPKVRYSVDGPSSAATSPGCPSGSEFASSLEAWFATILLIVARQVSRSSGLIPRVSISS